MGRVPGSVAAAVAIMVTDHGTAGVAAGPVITGAVLAGWKRSAEGIRSSEDVMPIGLVAAAVHNVSALVNGGVFVEVIAVALVVSM